MIWRRSILALALLTSGCTTDWSQYPWADHSDVCATIDVRAGVHRSLHSIPSAKGFVALVQGGPLPPGLFYQITFSNGRGSQVIFSKNPAFSFCLDDPESHQRYKWEVEVRASPEGPVLYRSPGPQVFIPAEPIKLWVVKIG